MKLTDLAGRNRPLLTAEIFPPKGINLEPLLKNIMQTLLEAAGAQRGALLLEKDGRLHLEIASGPEGTNPPPISPVPLPESPSADAGLHSSARDRSRSASTKSASASPVRDPIAWEAHSVRTLPRVCQAKKSAGFSRSASVRSSTA